MNLDGVDEKDGEKIVGHVFGDKHRQVVQQLGTTGGASTSQDLMRQLLPILAPIVMSYLAKRLGGGAAGGGRAGSATCSAASSAASAVRSRAVRSTAAWGTCSAGCWAAAGAPDRWAGDRRSTRRGSSSATRGARAPRARVPARGRVGAVAAVDLVGPPRLGRERGVHRHVRDRELVRGRAQPRVEGREATVVRAVGHGRRPDDQHRQPRGDGLRDDACRFATLRSAGTRSVPPPSSVVSFTPKATTIRSSDPATRRAPTSAAQRRAMSSLVSRRTPRLYADEHLPRSSGHGLGGRAVEVHTQQTRPVCSSAPTDQRRCRCRQGRQRRPASSCWPRKPGIPFPSMSS